MVKPTDKAGKPDAAEPGMPAAPSKRDEAHARRDERHAAKVWQTAEGISVTVVSHSKGFATVRPVGGPDDGSEDFQVPKGGLYRLDGDASELPTEA